MSETVIEAEPDGRGGIRLPTVRSAPPVAVRRTAVNQVHLVATSAGPLGGDSLRLVVRVHDGAALTVRTGAASIALRGRDDEPSHVHIEAIVGRDAELRWLPEPLVAANGCDHHVDVRITLAADARLDWRGELVLGRHAETPGRVRSRIDVERPDRVLLRSELRIGAPGWDGPAVVDRANATGAWLVVNPRVPSEAAVVDRRCVVLPLDGAALVSATADDAAGLRSRLEQGRRLVGLQQFS